MLPVGADGRAGRPMNWLKGTLPWDGGRGSWGRRSGKAGSRDATCWIAGRAGSLLVVAQDVADSPHRVKQPPLALLLGLATQVADADAEDA